VTMNKRCDVCKKELSLDSFHKNSYKHDGKSSSCKGCSNQNNRKIYEIGSQIKKEIYMSAGGCQNPSCYSSADGTRMLLSSDGKNYRMFQFDHIDESLKQHVRETNSGWIASHQVEFMSRVLPNLQFLCYQCHLIKSGSAMESGNSVHQKIFGRNPPSLFIEPEYNLFNQVQTTHIHLDEDNWSFEGDYSVCRDSGGFLIKYIDLQKGATQFQIFNKDGEQI